MCAQRRSRWGHIQTIIPNEKYRIHWNEGRDAQGKRIQRSQVVNGSWEDADYELARIHFMDQGIPTGVDRSIAWGRFYSQEVRPTFKGLATKTRKGYERVWDKELRPRIEHLRVRDTTWDVANAVIGEVGAPSVQRHAHALWKKMCNMAIRKGLLATNPVDRAIRMKPLNKRKKSMVEAEDMMGYLMSIRDTRYLPLVIMEAVGLMRHEEASAVCGRDVREEKGYAVVHVDKALVDAGAKELKATKNTHSERDAYFAWPFSEMLLEVASNRPRAIMESKGAKGEEPNESWYANPRFVGRSWKRWCEANGRRFVRFADMRTIASILHAEAKTPDLAVCLAMGHAEADGTTRGANYSGRTPKLLKSVADSIAEYIVSESPCCAMLHGLSEKIASELGK